MDLADPGEVEGALVPVLADVVGREQPLRVSVPEALSELPKIRQVLEHIRRIIAPL
uniref:hypothetical protein n=1 Tax=Corallococcus coralloides TaxID=184914 RepID=UPI001F0BDDC7|nr:hypothetical protein [Corallococcus coralloides]